MEEWSRASVKVFLEGRSDGKVWSRVEVDVLLEGRSDGEVGRSGARLQ